MFRFLCGLLLVALPLIVFGNSKESIAYIDALLKSGKTLAILLIDMQTHYVDRSALWEVNEVGEQQTLLISHYAGDDRVIFVNVKMKDSGNTLAEQIAALRQKNSCMSLAKRLQMPF